MNPLSQPLSASPNTSPSEGTAAARDICFRDCAPCFRIREKDLLYDVALLRDALSANWGNFVMAYSVKTNSLPWLLVWLKEQGFFVEVVSGAEYDLVRRLGYPDSRLVYNGPVKDRRIFMDILSAGGYVNLDSAQELDWVGELSALFPERFFRVGIRVNFDITALLPEETPQPPEGGRFGFCYENGMLETAVRKIRALPNVRLAGLHLHTSTQSRSVKLFGALARMAVRIAKELDLDLEYVDMGGGYFGGRDGQPDYRDYFQEIGKELRSGFDRKKTVLIAEPGISLISRAITFETKVLDVKDIRGRKFLVTSASRLNLNPQVTRHSYPHHIEYGSPPADRKTEPVQWVCGATCMEYDRLFELRDEPALLPGDKIIYDVAGGYTMSLTPLFIHYFPAVYVELTNGSFFVAREPWTNEEFLQKNHW